MAKGQRSAKAPQLHETLQSWERIRTRRRHHFTRTRTEGGYYEEFNDNTYGRDVEHYGDTPSTIDTSKTFRVLGGNIKGVKPAGLPAKSITIAKRMERLQVGHIALQETNSEWNKANLREAHTNYYQREFGTATFQYSTTTDKFDSHYKPGGTASGALGQWVHRIVGRESDPTGCGRWSSITYGGKAQKRLTILSVYRVGSDRRLGSTTARKQQHAILLTDKELEPFSVEPHKQTLIDLQYHVKEFIDKGHEVLVSIDANQADSETFQDQGHEEYGLTKQGFHYDGLINGSIAGFIENTGLINLTTHYHEGKVPKTHHKGKDQIDYFLGTEGVINSTEATGLLNRETLSSDHCSLFADLNIEKLLGIDEGEISLTAFRTLRIDDPRISAAYRKELHAQFTHHGVYKRVETLKTNSTGNEWDTINEMMYERTDKTIGEAMRRAAKCCTKTVRKQPWTKAISQATHLIRYWSARINRQGYRGPEDGALDYYRDNSGDLVGDLDRTMSVDSCIQNGIKARHRLKDVIKDSKENEQSFEEEIAAARVEKRYPHLTADNDDCAHEREDKVLAEIKNMGNRKAKKRTARKLAAQIKEKVKPNSTTKTSLNHVLIPTQGPQDTWRRITGKEDLEQHLKERNVKQFSEAGKTPFGYTKLGKDLGHTGDSVMAESILEGSLDHDAMNDEAIREIVNQLKAHPVIKKILEPVVTLEDFKEAVRNVPDKTASSYSGRGVPHYKACAEKTKDPLADILAAVHAAMMSVPLATGYCPSRWKHVIDVMLAKIAGIARTDKLRIIQLLEADLNQVLRIAFARNIARLAHEHEGIISEHQYGKADSDCLTPVINKLLTIQLLIQKKTEGIVFDNDAKGCYDLIISGISLATLRRIGFSKESVKLLGTLWAQLQHHVATGYGVSETTYTSTAEKLLYGIGQGSCASPILWALLNQLLMAALGDKFDCMILHAVDRLSKSKRPGDSFVDDTTTGVTNDDSDMAPTCVKIKHLTPAEEAMVELMEEIMQFFLDILQVIGGDLAFVKCVWFLICFRWRKGRARMLKLEEGHRGITLTSKKTRQSSSIKRKNPTESHTTLGFNIMGNGQCKAQYKHMVTKARRYGDAIKASTIRRGEASVAYNTMYMTSVGYGVGATTLSFVECEVIQRPVVNAILPKMGIARSAPRAVVFGTTQYGGMGLAHLAALQGHSRIQYLMGHLRNKDATGKLARTMIEYTKLECGCQGNPLMKDYRIYGQGIINKNWITGIWEHLSETNGQIDIPDLWEPKLGRQHDTVIMEYAYHSDMTKKEIAEANTCRIYEQAYFTSDLATLDGENLTAETIRGQRQVTSKSSWGWPVQQRPVAWGAWRKLLSLISLEGRLDQQLGDINSQGHRQHHQKYCDKRKMLWIKENDKWKMHRQTRKSNRMVLIGEEAGPPRDYTHVVQTKIRGSYIELTGKTPVTEITSAGPESWVDEQLAVEPQLPASAKRLKGDGSTMREVPNEIILATDGSVLFGVGYHSWIIANKLGEPCAEGGGPDDGDPFLMTSFRSELGGIAGGLAAIGELKRSGSTITRAKVICDNQSSIKRSKRNKTGSVFTATEGDYDLTAIITWLIGTWCKDISITFEWVKGHADDLDRVPTLEEELNIAADVKCDEIRAEALGPKRAQRRCNTCPTEVCSLLIKGTKITSHWKERLTQQLLDGKLRLHLTEKERWTEEDFDDICWHAQSRAMARISTTRRTAIAKLCHNLCFTGKRGELWTGDDPHCSLCTGHVEDWRHVITCKSIPAELARADSWLQMKKTMQKWKMPQDFWLAVEKGTRHYCQHPERREEQVSVPEVPFQSTANTQRNLLRSAFLRQSKLGWENFLKGRLTKAWKITMKRHYENHNIKLSVDEWAIKMVLALWDHYQRVWKFRNDTVHTHSSTTTKQYKLDDIQRKITQIQVETHQLQTRMTREQKTHFDIRTDKLQYESRRCWANISTLYIEEIKNRCDENVALNAYLRARGGVG